MSEENRSNSYLWCDGCRRSYSHADAPEGICPVCHAPVKPIGKFNAILRGLMANELSPSPITSAHRKMLKMMWSRNGMGEQYYRILAPEMSYAKFESAMTQLLTRGADEGWVQFIIPPAPQNDEAAYAMKVVDEERFVQELHTLAGPDASLEEGLS